MPEALGSVLSTVGKRKKGGVGEEEEGRRRKEGRKKKFLSMGPNKRKLSSGYMSTFQKAHFFQGLMAHNCNPSYLEG
jgi:hypothetical protein